jgi:acetylornithine deacetylase/succinyl-diaminopimelate desuccinylase-like protein
MSAILKNLCLAITSALLGTVVTTAQTARDPDWAALQKETLAHFQALIRFDTQDPPGREQEAADYLHKVLTNEGIPVEVFTLDKGRPNIVARLKGSGRKRPLLIMGHTDTVNIDPAKWTHPPFGAVVADGYVYGRGTIDDKDNVVASLMTMIALKRQNVPLDRDVIFLAESGEEGSTRVGIQFMVNEHFAAVDAEYCIAEGGGITREGGQVKYASVQTAEKLPRAIELTAKGPAGHGSVPLTTNAIARLSSAVGTVASWRPPMKLNETTGIYFKRLAEISTPEQAKRYRDVFSFDPKVQAETFEYLREHEPRHASMLVSSLSPNMIQAGYRVNVIPSEAKATLDVRLQPGEDADTFLETVRSLVNDPNVDVRYGARASRPATEPSRLTTEVFPAIEAAVKRLYDAPTLPTMSTGATDMAFLRAKGIQCYGIGPATDTEDGPKGFGAHSDQERILVSELHRFVQLHYEVVRDLARAQ